MNRALFALMLIAGSVATAQPVSTYVRRSGDAMTGPLDSYVASGGRAASILTGARFCLDGITCSIYITSTGWVGSAGITATSFTATATSGNKAFIADFGARWCFDGTTCALRATGVDNGSTDYIQITGGLKISVDLEVPTGYLTTVLNTPKVIAYGQATLNITGGAADGASAVGVALYPQNTYTTVGSKPVKICADSTCATEKLSVRHDGSIDFAGVTTANLMSCAAAQNGVIQWDTTVNALKQCNGTTWEAAGNGSRYMGAVDASSTGDAFFYASNNQGDGISMISYGSGWTPIVTVDLADSAYIRADSGLSNGLEIGTGGNTSLKLTTNDTVRVTLTTTTETHTLPLTLSSTSAHTVNGNLDYDYTDSSGTPGAATINKPAGRSAVASAASSVVITNSMVSSSTPVFLQEIDADATCTGLVVSSGSGSFTVTCKGAAATATLKFNWHIH